MWVNVHVDAVLVSIAVESFQGDDEMSGCSEDAFGAGGIRVLSAVFAVILVVIGQTLLFQVGGDTVV
jgi:hypothetical protein